MSTILEVGIDVSKWQGLPNWPQVVGDAQHIKFVFVKATQGTTYTDVNFDANCKGANSVGLEVGAYHFFDAGDSVAQANHFVAAVKPELLKRELVLDLESNPSNLSNAALTDAAVAFFNQVSALTGRPKDQLALYTNKNYLAKLDLSKLAGIRIWIAAYGVSDPGVANAEYWQNSETGHVAGISGYVDIDVEFAPPANVTVAPAAPVAPKPVAAAPVQPVYHPVVYTVVSGDSLSAISAKTGVSEANLEAWNGISNPNLIQVGQVFRLIAPVAVAPSYAIHHVVSGDTLSGIASTNHTTVSAIKSLNGLTSDVIYIGQSLKLPKPNSVSSMVTTNVATAVTHTVVSGDTLSGLAVKYQTTVAEIKSLNGLTSDLIRIGQVLNVGGSQISAPVQSSVTTHKVVSGDTLSGLAVKYNTTVAHIKSLNGLTSDLIRIGQILKV